MIMVDLEAKIRQLLPVLEEMMDTGLIAMSDVEVIRIRRAKSE